MSGTRSLSRTAPATEAGSEALVVVAHGDCGGLRTNRLAGVVAERVGEAGRFASVGVGYLRGAPALESVGPDLAGETVRVYPLFMSCGYYVNRAIPSRLGVGPDGRDAAGRPVRIMAPIGVRPVMAHIVADIARAAAAKAGFEPASTGILLVAHGSGKDPSSRNATISVAGLIKGRDEFRRIDSAFLEEAPFLADALTEAAGPLVVVGMFIGEGLHGIEDLGAAVAATGRADITLASPLARWPELAAAACDDILMASPD